MVIWQFSDGKPGHENQGLGLAEALNRLVPVDLVVLPVKEPKPEELPPPDLLVGVGHGTHRHLLLAKLRRRVPAIVLMKPSLPKWLFDLCLIPRHDLPRDHPDRRGRVIPTWGALNRVRPAPVKDRRGLFLVGGTSVQHNWDENGVIHAITALALREPDYPWDLTTSRRTPGTFLEKAKTLPPNVLVTPGGQTPSGWVPQKLARASRAWVTADSVSMVYEALSSGASVGVINVPVNGRPGRVALGADELFNRRWVCELEAALKGQFPEKPAHILAEADRCAGLVLGAFPKLAGGRAGPMIR